MRLIARQGEEYVRQWNTYKERCHYKRPSTDLTDFDRREHAIGLRNLDQATAALGKITEALAKVLAFPRDVLLENEPLKAFGGLREAAKQQPAKE